MLCKLHNPTNTKCTRNFFIAVIAEIVDIKYIQTLHNLHNVYWSVCQQILHRHKGRKFWAFLLLITSAEGRKKKKHNLKINVGFVDSNLWC